MARKTIKIPIRWKVTTKVTRSDVLRCPYCGYVLRRSGNRTGQIVTCGNCRNNVRV